MTIKERLDALRDYYEGLLIPKLKADYMKSFDEIEAMPDSNPNKERVLKRFEDDKLDQEWD